MSRMLRGRQSNSPRRRVGRSRGSWAAISRCEEVRPLSLAASTRISFASPTISNVNSRTAGGREGGRIQFCPDAAIRHLKAASGGHANLWRASDDVLSCPLRGSLLLFAALATRRRSRARFVGRPFRSVMTRHHLRRPWWIPVTFLAELAGHALGAGAVCARPALLLGAIRGKGLRWSAGTPSAWCFQRRSSRCSIGARGCLP